MQAGKNKKAKGKNQKVEARTAGVAFNRAILTFAFCLLPPRAQAHRAPYFAFCLPTAGRQIFCRRNIAWRSRK